jgi:hypothetical protein
VRESGEVTQPSLMQESSSAVTRSGGRESGFGFLAVEVRVFQKGSEGYSVLCMDGNVFWEEDLPGILVVLS